MKFLYGDSSPFPLDSNFIETLKGLVDSCAALLRVDEILDQAQSRWEVARGEADKEAARLEQLSMALIHTLEGQMGGSAESPNTALVASRVLKAARAVVDNAKGDITHRRDATLREVESSTSEWRAGILKALDGFFSAHELPGTAWRIRWKSTGLESSAHLVARATTTFGLDALLEVDLPNGNRFAKGFRLGDVAKGISVRLPTQTGLLRKSMELKPTNLDQWIVTEIVAAPERAAFVLKRPGKAPQSGIEIVVRAEGQSRPLVKPLSPTGEEQGETVLLDGVEGSHVQRALKSFEDALQELSRGRRHLANAVHEGRPVKEMERPATLAQKFIDVAAPLVREMRRRGATTRELVLKHDLGNGRREEIFVERKELMQKYADLKPARRAMFESLSLEAEEITESAITAEIVVGEIGNDVLELADDDDAVVSATPTEVDKPAPDKPKQVMPLALALTQLASA